MIKKTIITPPERIEPKKSWFLHVVSLFQGGTPFSGNPATINFRTLQWLAWEYFCQTRFGQTRILSIPFSYLNPTNGSAFLTAQWVIRSSPAKIKSSLMKGLLFQDSHLMRSSRGKLFPKFLAAGVRVLGSNCFVCCGGFGSMASL